jgi:Subtilisin-like serine proteases
LLLPALTHHRDAATSPSIGRTRAKETTVESIPTTTFAAGRYRYRPGQLLVHAGDAGGIEDELATVGYHLRDRHGPMVRFVGPVEPAVPELVERFGGRVTPNHVFTPASAGDEEGSSRRSTAATDRFTQGGGRQPGGIGGADYAEAVPVEQALKDLEAPGTFTVGVIDTGIVVQGGRPHSWFGDHLRFDDGDIDPVDPKRLGVLHRSEAHGTFVAGRILREAPSARVKVLRVLDDGVGDDTAVAAAIGLLAADGIELINLSFGGEAAEGTPPRVIEYALRNLPPEVVVVASAGNLGDRRLHWPGAFERVIAVGAVDETAAKRSDGTPPIAGFSSRGRWVDAYASGVRVVGPYCWFTEDEDRITDPDVHSAQDYQGWARWSGTSFAAATVTGKIAQLACGGTSVRDAANIVVHDVTEDMIDDGLGNRRPYVRGKD